MPRLEAWKMPRVIRWVLTYKIAVEKELKSKELKEITLDDFKLQHDFDIIWEKESIYADKYLSISEEFI